MILYPAEPADRERVDALARQVQTLHAAWRPDIYMEADCLYPPERFSQVCGQKQLYLARQDHAVVGYVLIQVREANHPALAKRKVLILDELCVDEPYRKRGFGKQIMEQVRQLGLSLGCTDLELSCIPSNAGAIALYEGFGMKVKSVSYQKKL